MQIPKLPTDNLYKFIALSGMLIFIISTVFPVWIIYEQEIKRHDLMSEMKSVEEEAAFLKKTFEMHIQAPHKHNKAGIPSHLMDYEKTVRMNARSAYLEGQVKKIDFIRSEIDRMKRYFYIGNFTGLFLIWLGFTLWYLRLQKFQDLIVKGEAEKYMSSSFEKE